MSLTNSPLSSQPQSNNFLTSSRSLSAVTASGIKGSPAASSTFDQKRSGSPFNAEPPLWLKKLPHSPLMNLRGSIPEFIHISDGKMHDVNILDMLAPMPGAFYIMDRAYLDFDRLHRLHLEKAFFVTRTKSNFKFKRRYSHEVDKKTGVQCDQTVILTTHYPAKKYPEPVLSKIFRNLNSTS